jgi:hypothetical protein
LSIKVLTQRPPRRDSLQNRSQPPTIVLPDTQDTQDTRQQSKPEVQVLEPFSLPAPIQRPNFIEIPRRLNLPAELQINTPEYTNALKQWFPAIEA